MRRLFGALAVVLTLAGPISGCAILGIPLGQPAPEGSELSVTRQLSWKTRIFDQPWLFPLATSDGYFLLGRSQPPGRGIPEQTLAVFQADSMKPVGSIARVAGRQGKAQIRSAVLTADQAVWLETTSTQLSTDGWTLYSAPLDEARRQSGPTQVLAEAAQGAKTPASPGGTEPSVDAQGNVWFSASVTYRGRDRSLVISVPADGSAPSRTVAIGVGASAAGEDVFYISARDGGQVVRRATSSGAERAVLALRDTGCSGFRDLVARGQGQAVVALECGARDRVLVLDADTDSRSGSESDSGSDADSGSGSGSGSADTVVTVAARDPGNLRSSGSLVTYAEGYGTSGGSRPMLMSLATGEVRELGRGYRQGETVLAPDRVGWWSVTGEGKDTTNLFTWAAVDD